MTIPFSPEAWPSQRAITALGISTEKRFESLADVPTFTESGYPEANVMGWKGVAGHPNLSDDIVKVWEEAIQKTIKDPAWLKFQGKLGAIPAYLGSSDFAAFLKKEFNGFRKLAVEHNLLSD